MGEITVLALPPWGQQVRVTDKNRKLIHTHTLEQCDGEPCCIHNPSDHRLKDADMIIRFDRQALIERICEHGVGHADPDSVAYFERNGVPRMGVHGCDGCC